MNKWIDTHAHYDTKRFNIDRNKLIHEMSDYLEIIINCGTNSKNIKTTVALTERYDLFYGVIGYFPSDVIELEKNPKILENVEKMFKNKKIVGVGEIGLDYHWNSVGFGDDKIVGSRAVELQKKWFVEQINFANRIGKPICIHSRDAEDDTLEILKKHTPKNGAVIHCFAYGERSAREYVDMGFFFGIGGTSTYKSNTELINAIKIIPIENIVLETDAPYLTPEPNRRTRNDSRRISDVIDNLTVLKGIERDEIIRITNENAKKVYNI